MKYSVQILSHFFNPKNVGVLDLSEPDVGRGVVGNYENGAVIHFYIKVCKQVVTTAKFKAYGNCPIIACCSYLTEWVTNKTLIEAGQLSSDVLIKALAIPELKLHCALLAEDALKAALLDINSQAKEGALLLD